MRPSGLAHSPPLSLYTTYSLSLSHADLAAAAAAPANGALAATLSGIRLTTNRFQQHVPDQHHRPQYVCVVLAVDLWEENHIARRRGSADMAQPPTITRVIVRELRRRPAAELAGFRLLFHSSALRRHVGRLSARGMPYRSRLRITAFTDA